MAPKKKNTEGKADVHPEGTAVNKQENTTTKKISTRKIHVNELHAKLSHPREDRIRATAKHLYYSVKGTLEVFKDWDRVKIKHKLLHKVAEERKLKTN